MVVILFLREFKDIILTKRVLHASDLGPARYSRTTAPRRPCGEYLSRGLGLRNPLESTDSRDVLRQFRFGKTKRAAMWLNSS